MRIAATILLLAAYLAVMLRPIGPYLEYAINKNYIAAVLCENKDKPVMKCDGKCYLRKQLKKTNQSPDSAPNQMPVAGLDYETIYSHVGGEKSPHAILPRKKEAFPQALVPLRPSRAQHVWVPPPEHLA